MCDFNCKTLKKCVYEFASMMNRRDYSFDEHQNEIIQYFEDRIVAFIPVHRQECVYRSLTVVINKNEEFGLYFPVTMIEWAIDNGMYKFVSLLLEYGGDEIYNKTKTITLGRRILSRAYSVSDTFCSREARRFLEGGPKTYAEYIFLKHILGKLHILDVSYVIICVYKNTRNMFELLLEYGTNLNYYYDKHEGTFSLLIKIIDISGYYPNDITSEFLDGLLSRYNFLMEGPGINYTDPKTRRILNVLEYAQSKRNCKYRRKLCEKIINYFIHRLIVTEINKIIPFPIAEEIVPHIIDHSF